MYRLGSVTEKAREMVLDDILRVRIDLLRIMATDYLNGLCPGDLQRRAMKRNAEHIETECQLTKGRFACHPGDLLDKAGEELRRRLMRLTAMIKAAAGETTTDDTLQKAMREDLEAVVNLLDVRNPWVDDALKVA